MSRTTTLHRLTPAAVTTSAALAATALAGAAPVAVLEPALRAEETYTESFVVIADLADGTYAKVQLGVSNAGPGDHHAACRVLVTRPGDAPWSAEAVEDRDGWRFDRSDVPALTIGPCTARAGDELVVSAPLDGGTLELTLDAPARDVRRTVHEVGGSDDFYWLEVLVPWAKARAKLARPGEPTRTSSGFGYADHSRATALPGKTARRWVRFRGFADGDARVVLVRFPPKTDAATGFVWHRARTAPNAVTRAQVTEGRTGRGSWRVMVDGDGGPWRLTTNELLWRDAPLEKRGLVGAMLGRVVGNPVTYTYRGTLEERQTRRTLTGIFELTLHED
ncbi:hypothetical protein L6R52_16355 [Myxococcota bacterium]|nr:hypothetical protein [Myxococcota bacterium]